MAEQTPPSSGSGSSRIDDQPAPNLPGFDLANRFINEWARGMTEHVQVHNRNWGKLRNGTLTFADLVKSVSDLWQSGYDTSLSLMLAPLRQDNVQWVNFVVDWSTKDGSLRIPAAQRVDVPRATGEGPPPKTVGMHVLGAPLQEGFNYIDASRVLSVQASRGQLKVGIDQTALEGALAGIKPSPGAAADFLGLVFEGPSDTGRPAVIVTLRILAK